MGYEPRPANPQKQETLARSLLRTHWTMDVGSLLHIAAMPLDKRYRPSRSPSISLPTLLSSPYLIPAPAPNLPVAHRQSILTFGHQRLVIDLCALCNMWPAYGARGPVCTSFCRRKVDMSDRLIRPWINFSRADCGAREPIPQASCETTMMDTL